MNLVEIFAGAQHPHKSCEEILQAIRAIMDTIYGGVQDATYQEVETALAQISELLR